MSETKFNYSKWHSEAVQLIKNTERTESLERKINYGHGVSSTEFDELIQLYSKTKKHYDTTIRIPRNS